MKFHDTLNQKLFNGTELKPEVKDKLNEIADAFEEYLEIPEDAILDRVLTGSSVSYNYTDYSDIDLHLVVDYDKVHEDCPIVEGYLWALKSDFNKNHDIFIYGIPVELYAEQKDNSTVHNGLYSLTQDKWIDEPQKIPPTDNDAAVKAKFEELKDAIDKCDDSEEADELLDKIYNMRKSGLAEEGEFGTENLAFKKLRDAGCLDKLRQLKKEKIDKQLSLESYNEELYMDNEKYIIIPVNDEDIRILDKRTGEFIKDASGENLKLATEEECKDYIENILTKNESINEENELDSSIFNNRKYERDLEKFIALNTGYACNGISKQNNKVKVDFDAVYKISSNDRQKLKNKLKKIGLIDAWLSTGFSYSEILGFSATPTEPFFKLFGEFYLEEDKKRKQKEAEEKAEFDKAVSEIDVSTFTLDDRDFEKMIYYHDKNSNAQRLADSVKDTTKALNRFVIAYLLNWGDAEEAFYKKLIKLGYDKVQLEAYKRKGDQLGIPQKFQDKIQVLKDSGVGGFGHEGRRLDNWAGLPKLDKWLNDNRIKYSVKSIDTPSNMLGPDARNGRCWTCAYELTIGDLKFIVANHTSEAGKGGAYGYSMQGEGVSCYETNQQDIINTIEKVLIDNNILGNKNESIKESSNEENFKIGDRVKILVSSSTVSGPRTGTVIDIRDTDKIKVEVDPTDYLMGRTDIYYASDLEKLHESIKENSIIDDFKEMVNKIAKDFKEQGYPKSNKYLLDFVEEACDKFNAENKDYLVRVSTDNDEAVLTLIDLVTEEEDDAFYQARIDAETKRVKFTDLENSNYAYESLNNALQKSICETIECKDPYKTEEEIDKDILENYPIYWDKNHEGSNEVKEIMKKSLASYKEDFQKLSRDDFKIIKTENGLYKVDGEYDSRIGYIAPNKNFRTVDNALGNAIYKYNTKFIQEDRKALISKLHRLFKQAGIPKMQDMKSSIRGYRPITKNGYYMDIYSGNRTSFNIGLSNSNDEYVAKIKQILDREGINYWEGSGYFTVDMEKQDNKNESIKEELDKLLE